MLRSHVVRAVFKRNVSSYFSGVLGYLFITVFVVLGSFLAFNTQFFTNNLANLDQLTEAYPMLLLFIVPAITMSVWAEERRRGTDELLFTLPATDLEILIGKYLAVLAVYSVALVFTMTHWLVLARYGDPGLRMFFTTYFGYWLAGAALLTAGMFASVLHSSTTVAFVLGAVICAVPVFAGQLIPWETFRRLTVAEQMREFGTGLVPLTSILYFVSLGAFFLYLNLIFIRRRHWSANQQTNMGLQYLVRTVSLAAVLISLNSMATHASLQVDMTAEKIFSLSSTTKEVLDDLRTADPPRPVTVQAFLSPEEGLAREYVPVRKMVVQLLRQFDREGGSYVDVRFVDVEPFSEQADEARAFGIEPRNVRTERDGRQVEANVFLGIVATSSFDEVVVPFFGPGTPVEYELTRTINTATNEERLTVGVLTTDADVMGANREWRIVTELKKQYEVEQVSPDTEIDQDSFDVLLAIMPSSLTEPQMQNFVAYVKTGNPVLIFDDPFPFVFYNQFGVSNAPKQPKPSPGGMFGMQQRQPPEPKASDGRATSLQEALDIEWKYDQIVWDEFNPHPEFFSVVPPEYIFVGPGSGVPDAFGTKSQISSGLQEVLAAFSGTVRPRAGSKLEFIPLLRTGKNSGLLDWEDFTMSGFDPFRRQLTYSLKPNRLYLMDDHSHVLAAHVKSDDKERTVNAVFVADVDLTSDWFFDMRERTQELRFDNVTFVLNAVDVLAGDESYLALRKRRAEHRTLTEVERQTSDFVADRIAREKEAEDEAQAKLEAAKQRFEKQRQKIENDDTLDELTKRNMLQTIKAAEERRLEVAEANIEQEKQRQIERAKAETFRKIRETENEFRLWAVLLPPIPAILLAIVMLIRRLSEERREITPERHV